MGYNMTQAAIIFLLTVFSHIHGQEVLVTLQSQTVKEGDAATFVCDFKIINDPESTYKLHNLAWLHNGLEFTYFNEGLPVEKNKDAVSNYTVSRNDTHSILQLYEVQFKPDSGNYSCEVEFIDPWLSDNIRGEVAHASLIVYVLPTSSSMYLSGESGPIENGDTVTIEHGKMHNFSCEVRGTRPKAIIKWYLGEELQESFSSTTGGGENELITTSSYWSIRPIEQHHDKELKCIASIPVSKDLVLTIQVHLHVKTMAPECDIKNISSMSAVVKCSPAYDSFDIRTYHLTFCKSEEPPPNTSVMEGGTVEFTLENLEPVTCYAFEVFTNDSFGLSETSEKTFTTLPRSPKDLGINAYVDQNGAISVEGIPASYSTSSSSFVRIERYMKHQEKWVTFGENLKEDIFNISFEDIQIRNCEGDLCSDATPSKQRAADPPMDVSSNCLGWCSLTAVATIIIAGAAKMALF